jgi:hypothetical protein
MRRRRRRKKGKRRRKEILRHLPSNPLVQRTMHYPKR